MLEPDAHELGQIARADPDRQAPLVDRQGAEVADAHAQKADPVFVGVEAGERLGKRLAKTIAAIRTGQDAMVDRLRTRIKADRVIAGRHDDALYARAARRLEHVVNADDVGLEDDVPAVLAGIAAEVD